MNHMTKMLLLSGKKDGREGRHHDWMGYPDDYRDRYGFAMAGTVGAVQDDPWDRSSTGDYSRRKREAFGPEMAKAWTAGMENEDGSHGPRWTMEQTDQVLAQKGLDCDHVAFFAILNSIYSDFCAVAKKYGVNNMDFYADMAKAWLSDKDAVKDKAAAYYEYVVRH